MLNKFILIASALLFVTCGAKDGKETKETVGHQPQEANNDQTKKPYVKDVHSHANINEVSCTHLFLDIRVDFTKKVIDGVAHFDIQSHGGDKMIFDSKYITINKIVLNDNTEAKFELGKEDELLGTAITVPINKDTKKVSIYYTTTEKSEALQWLEPAQTAGKKMPYLFTQGEAILTRTWIPCQDTPGSRITYKARVTVPKDMMAVMSAKNPMEKNGTGVYEYEMKQPIPTYLIALAAGDLEFQSLGNRTGVYTEPSMLKKCADELIDTEKMLEVAEKLYGPYKWDRYDIIVLPPSFPFGGMENPRLTFATPTIIAGDRSLTSLIAHEMAHSWSGNLVTNATWNDFWLNEGFTVYIERRIMEELYGRDYSEMLAQLGKQDLLEEIDGLKEGNPDDTKLKLDLTDRSPDDGMTEVAYEKGAFFLRMLEETAGREKFDNFLKGYFAKHQFQTMTTEEFLTYLDNELIKKENLKVNVDEWVYGKEIPANCAKVDAIKFKKVEENLESYKKGSKASSLTTTGWSTHEWLHFIKNLPATLTQDQLADLDNTFKLTESGNAEILCAWLEIAINNNYKKAYPKVEDFLTHVGRRKFLTPLYKAMVKTEEGKKMAKNIYTKARPGYHFVATNTIDKIVNWQ